MSRRAGAFLALLVLGSGGNSSAPQDDPRPRRAPAYAPGVIVTPHDALGHTFAVAARTVRVPVSVLDGTGEPVLGLDGSSFRVSEDGRLQQVSLFSGERRPLRLAVALDVSGSMDDKMPRVAESLRHFIALLEPADEILVMTFNDELRIAQDLTSDRAALARVLANLDAVGGTALYDAALEAIRRVAAGPAESKAVVLVTDGVDTSSATAFDDLLEIARRKEVPVFSIGLDGGRDPIRDLFRPPRPAWPGGQPPRDPGPGPRGWPPRTPGAPRGWPPQTPGTGPYGWPGGGGGWPGGGGVPQASAGPSAWSTSRRGFDAGPLLELAEQTGGRAVIVGGPRSYAADGGKGGGETLRKAVESIATVLRHRYLLGYEPPEGKRGWRAIEVEVDRPGLTAHARKGYYAGG